MFLTFVFKETSSVVSRGSLNECLVLLLALDPEYLKLSLDKWIELTVFGLTTIIVQGLLSFHHFENLGHRLWQHFEQQQQHKQIKVRLVVAIPTLDRNERWESIVECLIFQSCSLIRFSTSSTLWLAILKSTSELVTIFNGKCKCNSFNLEVLSPLPQQSYSKEIGGITSLLVRFVTSVECDWIRILYPYALHTGFSCNFLVPNSLTSVGSWWALRP